MVKTKASAKDLINVMVYVLFAVIVLPIIGSSVTALEGDTGNFSATEILLFGLITTFVIIGVVYAIIKTLL
ncbi:MAG: hypothetical protein BV457_01575 [Thermoplasmata archaeon M9B1D]|nr:MAG: hypothetical protein BV457_01575 [Thermoplasmata archaeon M9B1D]